ncbi:MAG TPA: kelch repeat-containing protein, partial [Candidatus Dormibacteraeota bacterium]
MLLDLLARLRRGRLAPLAAALALAVVVGGAGAALNLRPHAGPHVAAGHAATTPAPSPTPSASPAPPTAEPTPEPTPAPTPVPPTQAPTPVPTPIPPPPAPVLGGRLAPAMAWDGNTGTVLLFGGIDWAGHSYGDTWSWNGSRWTLLHPPTSPSPRSGSVMGWDP